MSGDRDERIRQRAHKLWESEGKPEGSAQRHWQQAEAEITQADSAPPKAAAKKVAAPKKAKTEGASRKTTGAGPALAKRSKDAKKPKKA